MFGRLATQVARWRLEKGASLYSIEQWLGSRTVFSAFLTQIRLGGLNTVGVSMTVIWALSPLGAQSVLRVFGTGPRDLTTHSPLAYFDTNTPPFFTASFFWGGSTSTNAFTNALTLTRGIYAASMLSADSTKAAGQDSWGNVKIPYLSSYANSSSGESWVRVPHDNSSVFSSLVGLPAASIQPRSRLEYTFSIESSYIEVRCSSFDISNIANDNRTVQGSFDDTFKNASLVTNPGLSNFSTVPNGTWQAHVRYTDGKFEPWILAADTFLDPLWLDRKRQWKWSEMPGAHSEIERNNMTTYSPNAFVNETDISASQAKIILMTSWNGPLDPTNDISSTTCRMSQPYIESHVECSQVDTFSRPNCSVVAQRPSQKPHASTNITHLSFPWVFSFFSQMLPMASGLQFPYGFPDTSILYLVNTSSYFMLSGTRHNSYTLQKKIQNITPRDVGYRLGQIINSFLIASQAYDSISGGTPSSLVNTLSAPASVHVYEEVYTVSIPWLAVFSVTVLVMLLGSIAGAVFCHVSNTPEILGFASAAIRDSKHVNLIPGFGALGGLEMTKALEDIEFRYGAVGRFQDGPEVLGVSLKVDVKPVEKGLPYV